MLETVMPVRFIHTMGAGRTKPSLIECEKQDGSLIELVVKGSGGTMQGTLDLAMEAIVGMLAIDLALPIPQFFAVELDADFLGTVDCPETKPILINSDTFAFGSTRLPSGFSAWGVNQVVPKKQCIEAAEIYTFDAIVINSDRRPENPNCLTTGTQLAIIDHELCFAHELFWKEPWKPDGFASRSAPSSHIFAKPRLESCPKDLVRFENAWANLDSARFQAYFSCLPPSWQVDSEKQAEIEQLLLDAKSNIKDIIKNSLGVLS